VRITADAWRLPNRRTREQSVSPGRTVHPLSGLVGYALSQSDRDWYGRTVPFEYDRRHAVGAAIDIALTPKVRVSVRSQYGSGFPVTPLHEEVVFNDARDVFPGPPPGSRFVPARDRDGRLFRPVRPASPVAVELGTAVRVRAHRPARDVHRLERLGGLR
jgi:hypothetical protein